jgi:Tfp pilus assembly protein PilN
MSASPDRSVLGISLMPQTIEAVLLREVDDRPVVVQRFSRPRLPLGEEAVAEDFAASLPGLKTSEEADFTLQVGAGGSRSMPDDLDLDLDPSLKGLNGSSNGAYGDGASLAGKVTQPKVFRGALAEILREAGALGCPEPEIVFVTGMPDIAHVEVAGNMDEEDPGTGWLATIQNALPFGLSRKETGPTAALRAQYKGVFDPKRVRFMPMTPSEGGTERRLALVPTPSDSVTPTLSAAFGEDSDLGGRAARLDAEVTLHVDSVRRYLEPDTNHHTAVVRVGAESTLILFMTGTQLRHVEHPRSLTSYDAPDTIASRVLLYQDEQQIERIDAVVLVGGPRDDRLVGSFRTLFPDAAVGRLHELLIGEHVTGRGEVLSTLTPESGVAVAGALRQLHGTDDDLNLLSLTTRQKKRRLPFFAWHTVAMLFVLAGATLFFTWTFVEQQNEISELRTRIDANPVALPDISPADLQKRVDSLNAVHAQYARSLHVLDSLLIGSVEWSRSIERTANQTESIEGIWFEEWSIQPSQLTIRGNAMDRNRVAAIARNLDGTVNEVMYAEIEDRRVYPFEITIPRTQSLPEAALFLREQDLDPESAASIAESSPAARAALRAGPRP